MWEVTTGYKSCGMEGAWTRRRWAAAGPGRQHTNDKPRPIGGRREACGARPLAATSLVRLEADAGPAGPGRASSRRAERSSRRGRRAGGQAARRPEICQGNKQQAERPPPTGTRSGRARRTARAAPGTPATPHTTPTQPPRYAKGAGTEVPAPCRLTQPRPRRGSGRMTVSPGDGDASTGTCRPRRPLPGPPRRSGCRSRCAQGAGPGRCSAWWPGRRARRNRSSHR